METTDGSPDKRSPRLTRRDLERTPKVWLLLVNVAPRREERELLDATLTLAHYAARLQRDDAFCQEGAPEPGGEDYSTDILDARAGRLASINNVAAGALGYLRQGRCSQALWRVNTILTRLRPSSNRNLHQPLDGVGAF